MMAWNQKPSCRHNPKFVFSSDNTIETEYWSADEMGASSFNGDLIVNFTHRPGINAARNIWSIPELAKWMEKGPEELVIGWPDFEAPPVLPQFWEALDQYAENHSFKRVCFHCMGGHGRTGTGLAAMLIALKKMDAEFAIEEVRRLHCQDAVETPEQIVYLFKMDMILYGRQIEEDELHELMTSCLPKIHSLSPMPKRNLIEPIEDDEDDGNTLLRFLADRTKEETDEA